MTDLGGYIFDHMPDFYHEAMMRFYWWRLATFPSYYRWKSKRRHVKNMMEKFGYVPGVGSRVEDCRGEIHKITEIDADLDTVILDDGFGCSLWHCCDNP